MSEENAVDAAADDEDAGHDGDDGETGRGDHGAESTGGATDQGDETTGEDDPSLVARVATHDEELATDVQALLDRVADLEAERDAAHERAEDLESRLKRTQADFRNYKKRAEKRQEQREARATEDLIERVVPVRDNLVRALDQDEDADIRDGVESTLEELDRVLQEENVEVIDPDPGEEVDPTRHEVLMRVDSVRPPGTVAELYRPGYAMADTVLREAQVTVSDDTGE